MWSAVPLDAAPSPLLANRMPRQDRAADPRVGGANNTKFLGASDYMARKVPHAGQGLSVSSAGTAGRAYRLVLAPGARHGGEGLPSRAGNGTNRKRGSRVNSQTGTASRRCRK